MSSNSTNDNKCLDLYSSCNYKISIVIYNFFTMQYRWKKIKYVAYKNRLRGNCTKVLSTIPIKQNRSFSNFLLSFCLYHLASLSSCTEFLVSGFLHKGLEVQVHNKILAGELLSHEYPSFATLFNNGRERIRYVRVYHKTFFFYLSHKPMLDNIIGNNLKIFSVSSSTVNSYGSVRMGGGGTFSK